MAELATLTEAELLERAETHLAAGVNLAILEAVLDGIHRTTANQARYRRGRAGA